MTRGGTEREASRMRRRVPCSEAREVHAIETSPHQPSLPAPVQWGGGGPQCRGVRDCPQPAGVVGAEDREESEA